MSVNPAFFGIDSFTFPVSAYPMLPAAAHDYHALCRDAIKATMEQVEWGITRVYALDDIEDVGRSCELPCIVCAPVGPEQDRPALHTNAQDGMAYGVLVALSIGGVTGGDPPEDLPSLTVFRRTVREIFHNKRLDAVPLIAWCEVEGRAPVFDKDSAAFQKLQTALVVYCVGRFPRE